MVVVFGLNSTQCYVKIFVSGFIFNDSTLNFSFATPSKTFNFATKF
jgi:hypothetical protein